MKNYESQIKLLLEKKSRIERNISKEEIKLKNIENQIQNLKVKYSTESESNQNIESQLEEILNW